MRLPRECYQVQKTIETHLPHLSQAQMTGLALWVCGAILAGSACQNAVASALSPWRKWNNLRQYLREWLYDGSDRTSPSTMKPRRWEYSRKPRVKTGCRGSAVATAGGKLSMTRYLGMVLPPKKAQADSRPAMTSSSFWLKVGQTKQCLE